MPAKPFSTSLTLFLALVLMLLPGRSAETNTVADADSWPAPVRGFVPLQRGEHPRLLFRKSQIQALRERATTPEGQAIIKRLRQTLNGTDGETLPPRFGEKQRPEKDGSGPLASSLDAVYTFSHTAGYGLLYILTGENRYAELGRQSMEKALEGYRDRDQRYSFREPFGALRAGPALGWTALGYDLCYDGWDEEFRQKVARAIQGYDEGDFCSLPELTRGARQHPRSNHWGMQVGGAALALLAIMNDPGVDAAKLHDLIQTSRASMLRNMTEGFGDGGFFAEGDGTGSMSSHIVFLSALQAWRQAAGLDFYSPRPNAQWMALKWFFLTLPRDGQLDFPVRGAYPHNVWGRDGLSGGGYFSIGFGLASEDQKRGMLWFYDHSGLKTRDETKGSAYDTPSPYPHHAILSFVNWPVGVSARNPGEVFPHAYRDSRYGFYAWRNRWQDTNDVIISILTRPAKGNFSVPGETALTVRAHGRKQAWGKIEGGLKGNFAPSSDGSTLMETGNGSWLAIDFSRASGCDALLALSGASAPQANSFEVNGQRVSLLLLTSGQPPPVQVQGGKVTVGGQSIIPGKDGLRLEVFKP